MHLDNFRVLHAQVGQYINSTYTTHYANKIQATDYIEALGWEQGFYIGNAIKYISRYGKKNGFNEADLMKAIHYLYLEMDRLERRG
jgi:hypothetical protein